MNFDRIYPVNFVNSIVVVFVSSPLHAEHSSRANVSNRAAMCRAASYRFIADVCREVVEFGPVNASIHKLNEHIAVENIEQLAAIFQKTLEKLLA